MNISKLFALLIVSLVTSVSNADENISSLFSLEEMEQLRINSALPKNIYQGIVNSDLDALLNESRNLLIGTNSNNSLTRQRFARNYDASQINSIQGEWFIFYTILSSYRDRIVLDDNITLSDGSVAVKGRLYLDNSGQGDIVLCDYNPEGFSAYDADYICISSYGGLYENYTVYSIRFSGDTITGGYFGSGSTLTRAMSYISSRLVPLSGYRTPTTGISPAIAENAVYNSSESTLTLPSVRLSDNSSFQNVVIRLTSFGNIVFDDPTVGTEIEFDLNNFALLLPRVDADGATFSNVSLTGPNFVVVSIGGVNVDGGSTGGTYSLDIVVTASGVTTPAIHVGNVPKPANQGEFCTNDIYQQFQQSVQGFSGSWQITNCTFDGTTGHIDAALTVTSPITISMPYSVQYIYTAQ